MPRLIKPKKLTQEQLDILNDIPLAEKKKIKKTTSYSYVLPEEYRGVSYPKIKMGNYIIVAYLYAREKKYFALENFKNPNVVYVDGKKIGLVRLQNSIEMDKRYNIDIDIQDKDEEQGTIGGKRPYTKFGKFLFKSWDWVDNLDVDRFIILYYTNEEERKKASERYFGNPNASVCDGLDYDFMRVD